MWDDSPSKTGGTYSARLGECGMIRHLRLVVLTLLGECGMIRHLRLVVLTLLGSVNVG